MLEGTYILRNLAEHMKKDQLRVKTARNMMNLTLLFLKHQVFFLGQSLVKVEAQHIKDEKGTRPY